MSKRPKEERDYNSHGVNTETSPKRPKVFGNITDVTPCYACEQGLGKAEVGLWKDVDDMIYEHVFASGRDFTAKEIYEHVKAHRLAQGSEEDLIMRPFEIEDVKRHMDKDSANPYWRTRKQLDLTSDLIDALVYDEDGRLVTLNKEGRDTYTKLNETLTKTLKQIEEYKKKKDDASKKA